jgi:hypothetical protein
MSEAAFESAQSHPLAKHDGINSAVLPDTLFVLDTTAIASKGPRVHDMIVADDRGHKIIKSYTFMPGEPLELPFAVAIKFLKIDAFRRTDRQGNILPYSRQPTQPDELGPGQTFVLGERQTVADYGELTNMALLQRALELPGGEAYQNVRDRKAIIDFIVRTIKDRRAANMEQQKGTANHPSADDDLIDIQHIDE